MAFSLNSDIRYKKAKGYIKLITEPILIMSYKKILSIPQVKGFIIHLVISTNGHIYTSRYIVTLV